MPKIQGGLGVTTSTPAPKKETKKASKPKKTTLVEPKKIVFEEVDVLLRNGKAAPCLTEDEAKTFLGWVEEELADKVLFKDFNGKGIRLWNSSNNRPFDFSLAKTYASEILQGHWRLNGETITIGQYGEVLSGQHRLAGLVLACQERLKNKDAWPFWTEPPTLSCLIVTGVEETDDVVNTIDTGKPRTLSDVLFRSEPLKKIKGEDGKVIDKVEREKASRVASYAIKFVGHRSCAFADAFAPKRTHSDSMDFLDRHSKLLKAVQHCYQESKSGKISHLSAGYASGLMYLMACSGTAPDKYKAAGTEASEKQLDFGFWDQAETFWTLLASGEGAEMKHVKEAIGKLLNADGGSVQEITAVIVKAWNVYAEGKKIKPSDLTLTYTDTEEGGKVLSETPTVGGIDFGGVKETDEEKAAETTSKEYDKRQKKRKADGKPAEVGSHVWVSEDGGVWEGDVTEIYDGPKGKVAKVKNDNDKEFEAAYDDISTVKPE